MRRQPRISGVSATNNECIIARRINMNKFLTAVAGLLIVLFALSPQAFAADAQQTFEKCKNQADAEEIDDADLKAWITTCMKDEGISAADTKALVDQEFSADDQQGAKSATMAE